MTASIPAHKSDSRARPARDAGGWLALAASPSFALMAWQAAEDSPQAALCAAASDGIALGGMAWMYLLMSVFHLPPWLRLAGAARRPLRRPTPSMQGD